jgi:DNA ligase-associated metallophosphoesterase
MLPPYETRETLDRLAAAIDATDPAIVVSLGDSFDDLDAIKSLDDANLMQIAQMQAGRDWVWIEGNHDPGPVNIGGRHLASLKIEDITYRHIAENGKTAEISGHYHPKCTVGRSTKPSFLIDADKVIMPAFGAYTGGLRSRSDVLRRLMAPDAIAVLTGRKALPVPLSAVS